MSELSKNCVEPFFRLSRNGVHVRGSTRVQSYNEQNMSSLSAPFLAERHFCCFVSRKLHLNIKTQKHYCNNHNRTVFFTITSYHQLICSVKNNSSACYHEHIS